MHVAVCFEFPSINGGENSFLSLLHELRDHSIRLSAIAPQQGPLHAQLAQAGIAIQPWREGAVGEIQPSLAERRARLERTIQAVAPDVVHANSLNMGRLLGPVTRDLGLPSIGHLRDIMNLSRQAVADLALHSRLLAVSAATRSHHVAQGLPPDRVEVLYNGVDLDQFRPRTPSGRLQRELGLAPDARLIGGIGQLGLRKGWEVALHAFQQVVRAHPQAHFVLVGEQLSQKAETVEYVDELVRLADQEPLRGHVHFLGRRTDVPSILNELDILLHSARQEPLGRVLLEAAASGIAIVATDVGGTREIFVTDDTARLVPADDAQAMADAVSQLLGDPAGRVSLAQAARLRMEQSFTVSRTAEGLARHYQAVAN